MNARYLSIGDLFGFQRCYVVPLFQRPYVWEKEWQGEPISLSALAQEIGPAPPMKEDDNG